MSVTYIIEFWVKPEQITGFHRLLGGVLDTMRREENFRSASLLEDPDDSFHLTLVETWADHDDVVAVQLARSYRDEWHAALPDLLVRDRGVSIWRPLRGDGTHV